MRSANFLYKTGNSRFLVMSLVKFRQFQGQAEYGQNAINRCFFGYFPINVPDRFEARTLYTLIINRSSHPAISIVPKTSLFCLSSRKNLYFLYTKKKNFVKKYTIFPSIYKSKIEKNSACRCMYQKKVWFFLLIGGHFRDGQFTHR